MFRNLILIGIRNVRVNRADAFSYMQTADIHSKMGISTKLFVPAERIRFFFKRKESIWKKYSLINSFDIVEYPAISSKKIFFRLQKYVLGLFYFSFQSFLNRLNSETIVYSFCPTVSFALIHLKKLRFFDAKIIFTQSTYKNTFISKYIIENVDGISTSSDYIYNKLINFHKIDPSKIFFSQNPPIFLNQSNINEVGIDKRHIKKIKNSKKKIITYAGKIGPDSMEVNQLIEAFNLVNKDTYLVLAGAREETGAFQFYKNFTRKNKFNDIFIIKHVDIKNFNFLIKNSDILIANYSSSNPLSKQMRPAKISSYLLSKKPIILPRIQAFEEFLNDEMVFFYNPDDIIEMARKIEHVLANPKKAKLKSEVCYKYAVEFSAEKIFKKKLDFFYNI